MGALGNLTRMATERAEEEEQREIDIDTSLSINQRSSNQEVLDYIMTELCLSLDITKLAFKGGYVLNNILPKNVARRTTDIDFSISEKLYYESVVKCFERIGDTLVKVGIAESYEIKDEIRETMSGGIKIHTPNKVRDLGVDVGLHDTSYGVDNVNIIGFDVNKFMIERMLADKMSAMFSRKRFRRPKDLYDFYVLTEYFDVDMNNLRDYIDRRGIEWDKTPLKEDVMVQYKKAYDMLEISEDLRIQQKKPSFSTVIERVSIFIGNYDSSINWNHKVGGFV